MPNTIRVNLSTVGNGCGQDGTPPGKWPGQGWYAFLYNCNGTPYTKAGKQYGPVPIDHGYCEFYDVERGEYLVFAIVNPFPVGPGGLFQANFTTHFAIVDVCECCETICVKLYNSG